MVTSPGSISLTQFTFKMKTGSCIPSEKPSFSSRGPELGWQSHLLALEAQALPPLSPGQAHVCTRCSPRALLPIFLWLCFGFLFSVAVGSQLSSALLVKTSSLCPCSAFLVAAPLAGVLTVLGCLQVLCAHLPHDFLEPARLSCYLLSHPCCLTSKDAWHTVYFEYLWKRPPHPRAAPASQSQGAISSSSHPTPSS